MGKKYYGEEKYNTEVEILIYSGKNMERVLGDNVTLNGAEIFFDKFAENLAAKFNDEYGGDVEYSLGGIDMDVDGLHTVDDEDCYISCTVEVGGSFSVSGEYYPATLECPAEYDTNEITEEEFKHAVSQLCDEVMEEMTGISAKAGIAEINHYSTCEVEETEPDMPEYDKEDYM